MKKIPWKGRGFLKLLEQEKSKFKERFPLVKTQVSHSNRQELFRSTHRSRGHLWMGLFYELVTSALFGGRVKNPATSICFGESVEGGGEDDIDTCPDVVSRRKLEICESKAMRVGHQLYLLEDQLDRYFRLQILRPDYEIRFVIYRHLVYKVKSFFGTGLEMYQELAKKTVAAFSIPLRMICELESRCHNGNGLCSPYVMYYSNPVYGDGYRLKGPFMTGVNLFPEQLMERMKFRGFEVKRYQVPAISVDRCLVNPFPITMVRDLECQTWVDGLWKSILGDVPF